MLEPGADYLVYVDPAPRGEWALALAALLPRERRSFHLLATEEDVQAEPDLLERARARLAGAGSLRDVVHPGPAEQAVAAEAAHRAYALLVVPPAGRNALQRMLKGSRVATVVRSVRAPVLVARRPPPRLQRILAAVSVGRATDAVIAAASELGAALGARVDYLYVSSEIPLPFAPEETTPAPVSRPDAQAAVRAALSARGLSGSLVVREGLVVDEILEAFEDGAHDLLVLGSGSAERGPFGSEDLAERILLRCSGSTLVVPPTV